MKKIIIFTFLLVSLLSACGQADAGKPAIVCTIFPQYDWVRQILGERADDFSLVLLGNRIDFHNYQPTVDDIVTISTCDLFVHIGGESDYWVDGVLANILNPDMVILDLLSLLDTDAFEETIEAIGFQHPDDHGHEDHGDGHDEHEHELDEHVWLSLANAAFFTQLITEAVISLDPAHRETYEANAITYVNQLLALHHQYQEALGGADGLTVVCADRFPFYYLAADYGISYYAAFPGCSADTEASFETVIFLAGKVDEHRLKNVIVTESSDQSIAQTIISNTADKNQKIHALDSMQSVSAAGALETSYLRIMEENLAVLREIF
jgi:zinc transport system substrate-binding protein